MQRDRNNAMRRTATVAIALLLLIAATMSAHAATITVTNTDDSGPGSLRQALANANNGDIINFAITGTIALTSGGLQVTKNVTISGPGGNQLSIDGNQSPTQPVFSVSAIATISGLTIRNGADGINNFGGTLTVRNCILSGNSFDGISNSSGSSLTIVNSNVSDNVIGISNHALAFGAVNAMIVSTTVSSNSEGGILTSVDAFGVAGVTVTDSTVSGNSGHGGMYGGFRLTVANSTISGNSSADNGGGIYGTSASIVNSTISGNSAETSGGGIYDNGGLSIANSTIDGNSAGTSGGGIYCGFTGVVNSTISGNSAGTSGGGIYHFYSSLAVRNSTITGNSAGSGGGVYNKQDQLGDSFFFFSNVILNAGASGENIFNDGGTVTSEGYNLSSGDGGGYLIGPGDQINTDPLLGPLQNNGGPTFTHALLPASPAIDAGDPNFSTPPSNDQRGCHFDRVFNGRIDIGSFETQPPRRPCPTPRPRPTPSPR